MMGSTDFAQLRLDMVENQIKARGVRNRNVLDAMVSIPREQFVPSEMKELAYEDQPLPIADGQSISQPYIVARMIEVLDLTGGEKILEIGTGSGYAAAVMAQIANHVYSMERIEALAAEAKSRLARMGFDNISIECGDGTKGWPEHAPYDAIIVAASGPKVPSELMSQLNIGGRLVIPVGKDRESQELIKVTRVSRHLFDTEPISAVRFVPLIGEQGWEPLND